MKDDKTRRRCYSRGCGCIPEELNLGDWASRQQRCGVKGTMGCLFWYENYCLLHKPASDTAELDVKATGDITVRITQGSAWIDTGRQSGYKAAPPGLSRRPDRPRYVFACRILMRWLIRVSTERRKSAGNVLIATTSQKVLPWLSTKTAQDAAL